MNWLLHLEKWVETLAKLRPSTRQYVPFLATQERYATRTRAPYPLAAIASIRGANALKSYPASAA